MKVVTPAQMRLVDDKVINELGVPSLDLMENAGRAVADVIADYEPASVVILAGPGNNGGDGLVAARYVNEHGVSVEIILFAEPGRLSGDARTNYERLDGTSVRIREYDGNDERLYQSLSSADVAIDALLGTGATGGLREPMASTVEILADSETPVVAVDAPSGIDSATGAVPGSAVIADETVTMGLPKSGLLHFPGRAYVGAIHVADIGFPYKLLRELPYSPDGESYGFLVRLTRVDEIRDLLPVLELNAHKGSAGRAYLLAGSQGMAGAAVLAAQSALRAGAGLVYAGIPKCIDAPFNSTAVETVAKVLPDADGMFAPAARDAVLADAADVDAFCAGPGIGRGDGPTELLAAVVSSIGLPTLIDADGINVLGLNGLKSVKKGVISPHPGETAGLYGTDIAEIEADRVGWARRLAEETGLNVILKGYLSVVTGPGKPTFLNPTGNPGMATAGSGDVLSGIVLAFLAAGLEPFEAALAGTYVHGLAGDIAAAELGERSVIAGDIMDFIPGAFDEIENVDEDLTLERAFADYTPYWPEPDNR
ncbi:MAG: NAD(P)H-hydrate dehydratase [Candidatus Coatesbacteria bacterium]|nr:MAG: NAD(P)H-hydrate dehydratase [Candidatus Coatesbacteria bacterium]